MACCLRKVGEQAKVLKTLEWLSLGYQEQRYLPRKEPSQCVFFLLIGHEDCTTNIAILPLRSRSETRSSYITVSFSASPCFQKLGRLTVLMYYKRGNLHSVGRRIENAPPTQLRRKILSEYFKNNRYPPITFL